MTISELRSMTPDAAMNMSDAEIIKAGKAAQRFVNQRLSRLEKAGLRGKVTSGGARRSSLKKISSRERAEKAILQAQQMGANPLSTPGKIHKAMKQAGLRKNPRTGKWSAKQARQWIRQQTGGAEPEQEPPEWSEGDITTTLDEFFDWARENHPEWSSKQTVTLYWKAIQEYNVDPIKFWSSDYEFRKYYYNKHSENSTGDSKKIDPDDLMDEGLYTEIDDLGGWGD